LKKDDSRKTLEKEEEEDRTKGKGQGVSQSGLISRQCKAESKIPLSPAVYIKSAGRKRGEGNEKF